MARASLEILAAVTSRASLDRAAEDGCPQVSMPEIFLFFVVLLRWLAVLGEMNGERDYAAASGKDWTR
jgi:hypothetical protein